MFVEKLIYIFRLGRSKFSNSEYSVFIESQNLCSFNFASLIVQKLAVSPLRPYSQSNVWIELVLSSIRPPDLFQQGVTVTELYFFLRTFKEPFENHFSLSPCLLFGFKHRGESSLCLAATPADGEVSRGEIGLSESCHGELGHGVMGNGDLRLSLSLSRSNSESKLKRLEQLGKEKVHWDQVLEKLGQEYDAQLEMQRHLHR